MSMAESWLAVTDDALLSEPVVLMAAHSGPHSYMLLRLLICSLCLHILPIGNLCPQGRN